jgi:hypothetical protein
VVAAQNKISGEGRSTQADQQYQIQVPDRPGYTFSISQNKFTWTKPWEILGLKSVGGIDTASTETSGGVARFHGLYVETMENGDKAFYRYEGTAPTTPHAPGTFMANWTLVGGTGKLEGITGKGTCRIQRQPDGTSLYTCEGEYQMPR